MDELTTDAVQKAENTSEDSQLIANVVAVVNDDLVNKVVEEVSKTSTDEKQELSAKVLKAIVDTQPSKIETLNTEVKEKVIEQAIDAAKEQQALIEQDMAPFGFVDDGTPEEEKEIIDEYGTVWHPVTRKGL